MKSNSSKQLGTTALPPIDFEYKITVKSLNISEKKGTIKLPVEKIKIDEKGIIGDAHAGDWHRQVSLLDYDSVQEFSKKSRHQEC